jgi:hypothetical protein
VQVPASDSQHLRDEIKALEQLLPRLVDRGALNDLVLRGKSEIYVTDTEGNHVFHFDRETHQFTDLNLGRPVFEPNGITVSDDGNSQYVGDDLGVIRAWICERTKHRT